MVIKLCFVGPGSALGTLVGQEKPTAKLMGKGGGRGERERGGEREGGRENASNTKKPPTQDEPTISNSKTLGRKTIDKAEGDKSINHQSINQSIKPASIVNNREMNSLQTITSKSKS